MKSLMFIVSLAGIFLLFSACGGGTSEFQELMEEQFKLMDGFYDELANSDSVEEIISVYEKYGPEFSELNKKMKNMKFTPEDMLSGGDLKREAEKYAERMKGLEKKMKKAFEVLNKFRDDPRIQEAWEKLTNMTLDGSSEKNF